eukprot:Nk52_evm32s164 gene=Nk52_evmTU32s164
MYGTSGEDDEDAVPNNMEMPESAGSSISSNLQQEYEQLLENAEITPLLVLNDNNEQLSDDCLFNDDMLEDGRDRSASTATAHDGHIHISFSPKAKATGTSRDYFDCSSSKEKRNNTERKHVSEKATKATTTKYIEEMQHSSSCAENESNSNSKNSVPAVDEDMAALDKELDKWTGMFKTALLGEFSQMKNKFLQRQAKGFSEEKSRYVSYIASLQGEVEKLREAAYERDERLGKQDGLIQNLSKALQQQKRSKEVMKKFCQWKLNHAIQKQQEQVEKFCDGFFERNLKKRALKGFMEGASTTWKSRAQKACQMKAQEVCEKMQADYEMKIGEMNKLLQAAHEEITILRSQRHQHEENMKKAFMRGVCALNMEAMTMFRPEDAVAGITVSQENANSKKEKAVERPNGAQQKPKPHHRRVLSSSENTSKRGLQPLRKPPPSNIYVERHRPAGSKH